MSKMNKPLISYVITAYNIEHFIADSIECAFKQTYEPLEIVLSDDCSTDGTFNMMKKMASQYTGKHKVILNRNARNLGITLHMNKAYMELASGEIIIAAHGDDISTAERAQRSCEFLSAHADYTAIAFSMVAVDEKGNVLKDARQDNLFVQMRSCDIRDELENKGFHTPAPSRAFRKYVMSRFGPINKDCPTEDDVINFRAVLLGKLALLPEVCVYYRKHKGGSSNVENFDKYPLEEIYLQHMRDMNIAVEKQYISESQMRTLQHTLKTAMIQRKHIRKHLVKNNFASIFKILCCGQVSVRSKCCFVRSYISRAAKSLWSIVKN